MCKVGIVFVILCFVLCVNGRKKKDKHNGENEVLEKSEVILKFPTYALKMPPIITSRKRTSAKVDPAPISCTSSNISVALNELRKKIRCIPRDTLVEVTAPDGFKVLPNAVMVKRCGGICTVNRKCISLKRKNVDFTVRTTQEKTSLNFCSIISVPEDVECECNCPVKKRCSVDQKFDSVLCKCVCTNEEEKLECLNKEDVNFKWSTKNCSCGCKKEKICTTGTAWSKELCKCVKV